MGSNEEESHIVEHIQDFGWEDNTASQNEGQYQDIDYLLSQMQ